MPLGPFSLPIVFVVVAADVGAAQGRSNKMVMTGLAAR